MSPSLKQQLLVWLLVPLLVMMPIVAVVQYKATIAPAKREIDRQLGDFAIAIASFIKTDGTRVHFDMASETEHLLRTDQLDTVFFLVLDAQGQVLGGDAALNTTERTLMSGELRYADREIGGKKLRMLLYGVACGVNPCQVRIAETLRKHERLHYKVLGTTLLSILILSLSTAGVMLIAVRHALRPLQDLRQQLAERSLDDLRPVLAPQVPSEVQPLVMTLNQLFGRMKEASDAQKSFIADAAHQLRTPLAAMQTEAELALLELHPDSIHPTLERLHRSASRAAKLANQLLTIARTDPSVQTENLSKLLNIKDICILAANEWSHQALVSAVDLGFELESATLQGQAILLQELLSNLIHNAIEHAGSGAQITVRTYRAAENVILEVEDNGAGIDETERQQVLQRFHRGRHAKGNGSGLGLAIVHEIAKLHQAELILTTPQQGQGLLVRVVFAASSESVQA